MTAVPVRGTRPAGTGTVLALARVEARRMLRHPALPVALLVTAWFTTTMTSGDWSGAVYTGLPPSLGPLLLGLSLVSLWTHARDRTPLAEDAPVQPGDRALARLLAGVALVAVVAAVTAAGAVTLRVLGGLDLGDEPGRTLHAHFTLPELAQPVVLAALAVALGAAAARVVRQPLAAAVVLFVVWFLTSATYWLFNGPAARAYALIQVQPVVVPAGPATTDPQAFAPDWLLTQPSPYQDFWGRLVVSPALAGWHDVYLAGLTLLLSAVALGGRPRRVAGAAGAVLVVAGVVAQRLVSP
jgi:hypothetical protein